MSSPGKKHAREKAEEKELKRQEGKEEERADQKAEDEKITAEEEEEEYQEDLDAEDEYDGSSLPD